jgi:hypothetical protein
VGSVDTCHMPNQQHRLDATPGFVHSTSLSYAVAAVLIVSLRVIKLQQA